MNTKPLTLADVGGDGPITTQDYAPKPRIDGVKLVDLKTFSDDGGYFLELSRFPDGHPAEFPHFDLRQLNYSEMFPGVVKAGHLHLRQEDIWFVPPSHRLLVGLLDLRKDSPTHKTSMRFIMGGGASRLLWIPRGVAHGAANLWDKPAAILYLVNDFFESSPEKTDELRVPPEAFGEHFWEIQKG